MESPESSPSEQALQAENAALTRAVRLAGGFSALGRLLGGLSGEAVRKWHRKGVPAERLLDIERVTNNQVLREELRPDLYTPRTPVQLTMPGVERSANEGQQAAAA